MVLVWAILADDSGLLWTAIGGAVVAILGAVGAILGLLVKFRKESRTDLMGEYDRVITRQDRDMTAMATRIEELTKRVFQLQDAVAECRAREADMRADSAAAYVRIRSLESIVGSPLPATVLAGIVVADTSGRIRVFSPSLTPLLRWLPKEIEGKQIDVLIPPDILDAHHRSFKKAVERGGASLDPGRVILSYAQDKHGNRVPVSITLSGWSVGSDGLVAAEIRQRVSTSQNPGDSGTHLAGSNRGDVPLPQRGDASVPSSESKVDLGGPPHGPS